MASPVTHAFVTVHLGSASFLIADLIFCHPEIRRPNSSVQHQQSNTGSATSQLPQEVNKLLLAHTVLFKRVN